MPMTERDPALERAKRRVEEVSAFYYHLMTYVLVGAFLVIVDLQGGANNGFLGLDFAHWVIIFWGFGMVGHGISVYFGEYRVQKLYAEEKKRELQIH